MPGCDRLRPPLFEIGLKGYVYGRQALELARAADRLSRDLGVTVILDPQLVDLPAIAAETEHLLVFAQHMDPVTVGRGAGAVLPEALKAAGAHGTVLNHSERPVPFDDLARAIRRADDLGLLTLVCADSPEEAGVIAQFAPTMILAEPPALIGTGQSLARANPAFITRSRELVKRVNPDIIVFNSAGIRTPRDVADIIRAGAEATGVTSAIVCAPDPIRQMERMLVALKNAWEETHP